MGDSVLIAVLLTLPVDHSSIWPWPVFVTMPDSEHGILRGRLTLGESSDLDEFGYGGGVADISAWMKKMGALMWDSAGDGGVLKQKGLLFGMGEVGSDDLMRGWLMWARP